MLHLIFRALATMFGAIFFVTRICVLGSLGLATILSIAYSLYDLVQKRAGPALTFAILYPGVYDLLPPPHHVIFNSICLFLVQLPLVATFVLLFFAGYLLDRLARALLRWLIANSREEADI